MPRRENGDVFATYTLVHRTIAGTVCCSIRIGDAHCAATTLRVATSHYHRSYKISG